MVDGVLGAPGDHAVVQQDSNPDPAHATTLHLKMVVPAAQAQLQELQPVSSANLEFLNKDTSCIMFKVL